ncbi:MAG: carbohydrate binding domain-containing protein [Candidatus Omnitrophica bacterium]|nr:carbohydrate binding domain-containing protein [Candidatus Omnitrophota bacterium]MDD5430194.1 carbohydrate binding domain-containing protein [Candidatus Omnitrophota bacterium]
MKQFSYLLLGGVTLLALACSQPPEDVLVDSFEGMINSETVDFGSSENSSLSVSAGKEQKICGQQSLKIEYELKPSGYMWIARGYGLDVGGAGKWEVQPQDIAWKKYNAISVQVYGSNSSGVIAFDLKDKGGELWRFIIDDDFSGWKEVVCPLKEFFPRGDWQPDTAERNEKLDFPVLSFQFEPRLPGKGTYYFDCVKLTYIK